MSEPKTTKPFLLNFLEPPHEASVEGPWTWDPEQPTVRSALRDRVLDGTTSDDKDWEGTTGIAHL